MGIEANWIRRYPVLTIITLPMHDCLDESSAPVSPVLIETCLVTVAPNPKAGDLLHLGDSSLGKCGLANTSKVAVLGKEKIILNIISLP